MFSRQLRRFLTAIVVFLAVFAFVRFRQPHSIDSPFTRYTAPTLVQGAEAGPKTAEEHFSPEENLEQIDIARLREAQHNIDIAMYAFTDKFLADALIERARQGVVIRIYRDREQYEQEEKRSSDRRESVSAQFANEPNIHIRVKHSHELMHLKAYLIDGRVLRTGSANWSPTGLKRQDNNAHFSSDPEQIKSYQSDFEEIWNRTDNQNVQ